MKDFLQDVISHTHAIGVLPIIKITSSESQTKIESISEDLSLIFDAVTNTPVPNLNGEYGLANLNILDLHLKCPEYKKDANITFTTIIKDNVTIINGIHFENSAGDYSNDYRFMSKEIVDLKIKTAGHNISKWDITFEPIQANIQRFKYQASAHTNETFFKFSTKDGNLMVNFGDQITHSGSFMFHQNVSGKLKNNISIPITEFLSVLNLVGDKTIKIIDVGAVQVTVDSGLAVYNYTFPSHN